MWCLLCVQFVTYIYYEIIRAYGAAVLRWSRDVSLQRTLKQNSGTNFFSFPLYILWVDRFLRYKTARAYHHRVSYYTCLGWNNYIVYEYNRKHTPGVHTVFTAEVVEKHRQHGILTKTKKHFKISKFLLLFCLYY